MTATDRKIAVLEAQVAALSLLPALVANLTTRIDSLTAGPRDSEDAAVVMALAETFASHWFNAADVRTHARRMRGALAAALEAADLTSAREIGHWLRRMQGADVGGLAIVRGLRDPGGRRWSVRLIGDAKDAKR